MSEPFDIDIVVVGSNCASQLNHCFEQIKAAKWSRGQLHLYYLDLGSSDNSVEIATGFDGVDVVDNPLPYSAPGVAYNRAWRAGSSPYVQFVSASCSLDPEWIEKGMAHMGREVGAVSGVVQPTAPEASIFNWIHSLEWRHKSPSCGLGRNFLIRRELLEELDGFDEQLPFALVRDISEKIDSTHWRRLDAPELMMTCDLGRCGLRDWLREGVEDGQGRAALRYRDDGWPALFAAPDLRPISIRGGISQVLILFVILGWLFGSFWYSVLLLPAALLLLWPRIFRLQEIGEKYSLSPVDAAAYGWHIALVVIPQFWGLFRFVIRKLFPK